MSQYRDYERRHWWAGYLLGLLQGVVLGIGFGCLSVLWVFS